MCVPAVCAGSALFGVGQTVSRESCGIVERKKERKVALTWSESLTNPKLCSNLCERFLALCFTLKRRLSLPKSVTRTGEIYLSKRTH